MSPHILNSLRSISINIVAPGLRSAQYNPISEQNHSNSVATNDLNNNPNNNTIQCHNFDSQPSSTNKMDNKGDSSKPRKMPLLGRYRREQASSSRQEAGLQQQRVHMTRGSVNNELVCQSPMFGMRRQINLNRYDLAKQQPAANIKQSRSSPSLASKSANETGVTLANRHEQQQEQPELLPQQITRQQIHYAFTLMDSNSDGMIDLRDLSQMLANLGVPIDESVLSYIITTVSRRGDHRISESEFLDWLGQFVQVTTGSDERPASAVSIVQSVGVAGEPLRRYRSGRTRFRLAGGSSGSSLVAKSNNELPENFGPSGRRRGSVGSGLALMRSLSGSSVNSANNQQEEPNEDLKQQQTANSTQQQQHQQADDQEMRQDLRAAFCVFDLDGDGYITFEEVRSGLRLLGEAWTTAEMSKLFSTGHLSQHPNSNSASSSNSDLSKQRISIDDFVRLLL